MHLMFISIFNETSRRILRKENNINQTPRSKSRKANYFKPAKSMINPCSFLTKCAANKLTIYNYDRGVESPITKKLLQPVVKFLHEPEPYMNLLFASSMRSRNVHAAFSEATMSYAFFFYLVNFHRMREFLLCWYQAHS